MDLAKSAGPSVAQIIEPGVGAMELSTGCSDVAGPSE